MSVRPSSNSGRISRKPSSSCLTPRPLGMALVLMKGLRTYPMGVGVNKIALLRWDDMKRDDGLPSAI